MNNVVDLNFETFSRYDYMLYEQRFFKNMLELYEGNRISYIYIGLDLFKNTKLCPILVDLKTIDSNVKESFFNEVVLMNSTDFYNYFDYMYIAQNLIKTSLDMNDLADLLVNLMLVGSVDKYLFRFYDPRVGLHLNAITFDENKIYKNKFHNWKAKFNNNIDLYTISINGEFRSIDLNRNPFKLLKALDANEVEYVNREIKNKMNEIMDNEGKAVRADLLNRVVFDSYKKLGIVIL